MRMTAELPTVSKWNEWFGGITDAMEGRMIGLWVVGIQGTGY